MPVSSPKVGSFVWCTVRSLCGSSYPLMYADLVFIRASKVKPNRIFSFTINRRPLVFVSCFEHDQQFPQQHNLTSLRSIPCPTYMPFYISVHNSRCSAPTPCAKWSYLVLINYTNKIKTLLQFICAK